MSIPAFHWALSQRTESSSQKAVLKCLAEWMIGEEAIECWPTVETIAFETDLNRETVMKATRALEKAGLIQKRRTCKGLLWQTRYTFVGYVPSEWIGSRRPTVRTAGNADVRKDEGTENQTSEKQDNDSPENRTVDGLKNHTVEGTENRTRTWIDMEDKESTRISMRTSAIAAVASAQAQTPYPEDFDQSLFDEAQREAQLDVGSKPNTVKAEAPKHRTTTPRKKPATRCPFGPDASIPPEYLEIAQKAGIGDPQQVFSAFVNHAIAHDRSLVVWPAGFRTWCSNELRYHPNQTPKPKPLHQRTAADYDW